MAGNLDGRTLRMGLRIAAMRLRFPAILAIAALVVGRWDAMGEALDRAWNPAARPGQGAVSAEIEYFCPMDPGVLGEWPGKCPVCNMALARRQRGDATPLPEGVVTRMQASPYRIQLAGIRTAPVVYRTLAREVEAVGTLEGQPGAWRLAGEVFESDAPLVAAGQPAEVRCESLPGRGPFAGKVVESIPPGAEWGGRFRVMIAVEDDAKALQPGLAATARILVPLDRIEPFRSQPADPPALCAGEPRAAFVCPDHADVVRTRAGRCPKDKLELERRPLAENARLRYWCPMHPEVVADAPGAECQACNGMKLLARVLTFRPRGQVLSVPEGAIVDTGTRTVAYVERMPGMFDGVEVVVGPRCGGEYPVVSGLEAGQRVAAAGAFLIDAETRLNPAAGAAYFGGRGD